MTQMADTPTTDLWIGFRSLHGGQFYWTDGRPRKYVNLGSNVSGQNLNSVLQCDASGLCVAFLIICATYFQCDT